jgi:hypothetical protein
MFYIMSLGITSFLLAAGATLLMRGLAETGVSQRARDQHLAFQMAEAGIDRSLFDLETPSVADDILTDTLATMNSDFSITSSVPSGDLVIVQSRGTVRPIGTPGSEIRDVEAVIERTPESVFQFALFGSELVNIGGSTITDSYDSSLGLYGSQTPGDEGDVGTNATTNDGLTTGITVEGTTLVVNGQMVVGPEVTDFTDVVQGNVNDDFITGDPPYVSQPREFPMPDDLTAPPPGCETVIPPKDGNTITLQTGVDYCPIGDLTINGGERFTANGPVKIYLAGTLIVTGNAQIGVETNPSYMAFLIASSGGATFEGTLTGSSEFWGTMYGPHATISISGNADIYGSIIAENVDLSGEAQIHYDESLGNCDVPTPPPSCDISNLFSTEVVAWRDL